MNPTRKLLIVEDNPGDARLIVEMLRDSGANVVAESLDTLAAAVDRLAVADVDIALLDLGLPDSQGLETFARLRDAASGVAIIVLTGRSDTGLGIRAVQQGAQDFLVKGKVDGELLTRAIAYAIERKRVETALRLSEEKYAAAFHASPDSITITRLSDGKLVEVNEGYERLMGYTRAESIGKTTVELSAYVDPGARDRLVTRLRETGEVQDFDAIVRRKDGTSAAVMVTARVLDLHGEECFLAVAHDVTERRWAERELRESEAALREAQRIGQIGSYDWDARTDAITWSDEYYHIYGLDPSQAPPGYEEHLKTYSPESAARLDAAVKAVMQTGEPYVLDLEEVRSDGTRAWITARGEVKRDTDGTIIGVHGTVQDVTERKEAEEERLRAERFFRDTFEHADVGIAHVNSTDGSWLRVNQRLCELLGYTREELLRTTFAAITHPDDVEENVRHLHRMLAGDEATYAAEKRYLRKDGSIVWVHMNVAMIRNEDGTPDYNITVLTDITERKQAEEALAASERFSERVLDTSPNLIYIYDLVENRNVYTNREITDFLGYTPKEVLGFGSALFERILHPDDAALVAEHHARLQKLVPGDDSVLEVDYRMKRADGEWRWLHSRDIPFARDGSGTVTQILGSTEDVTDRKAAAERLRESEDRYRLLFENANDAVYVHEISAGAPGRFIEANRYASKMLGYSHEEFLAMEVPAIDTPEQTVRAPALVAQLVATNSVRFETEHLAKNGERVPVEISNVLFDLHGTPTVLSIVRDITERKRAEEALASSESRLKAIFDQAPLGIALVDSLTGRMDEVNPMSARIAGRTIEEMRELDWMSITHPDDVQADLDNMALMNAGKTNGFQMEKRFLRPDGSAVWVSMTVAPVLVGNEAHPQHVAMVGDITASKVVEEELARQAERVEKALASVIDIAGNIGEMRDPYTAGHQRRVAELATRIAQDLGMPDREISDIRVAGLLHDMGKAGVPTEILGKPGAISPSEFELIKGHAEAGYRIAISANMEEPIPELIHQHHERCDGSGYPLGLLGDQMLTGAKVLAVADVVEAMMSHRPYRPALGIDTALDEIERGAGSRYDADVSRACVALFREGRFELSL